MAIFHIVMMENTDLWEKNPVKRQKLPFLLRFGDFRILILAGEKVCHYNNISKIAIADRFFFHNKKRWFRCPGALLYFYSIGHGWWSLCE